MTETQQATRGKFEVVTIDVDGHLQLADWDLTAGDTLSYLQAGVGGLVEAVQLDPAVTMWVNEEGILQGLPVNPVATTIARMFGFTHQEYYGPAVFTGGADDDGDTLALPPRELEALVMLNILIRSRA